MNLAQNYFRYLSVSSWSFYFCILDLSSLYFYIIASASSFSSVGLFFDAIYQSELKTCFVQSLSCYRRDNLVLLWPLISLVCLFLFTFRPKLRKAFLISLPDQESRDGFVLYALQPQYHASTLQFLSSNHRYQNPFPLDSIVRGTMTLSVLYSKSDFVNHSILIPYSRLLFLLQCVSYNIYMIFPFPKQFSMTSFAPFALHEPCFNHSLSLCVSLVKNNDKISPLQNPRCYHQQLHHPTTPQLLLISCITNHPIILESLHTKARYYHENFW
jgi:hypothetical protein